MNERGGVLEALVNYWFRRIECADSGDTDTVPEWNLAGPAQEPMEACFRLRGVAVNAAFVDGFGFGLRAARSVMSVPLDCEARLRHILTDKAAEIKGFDEEGSALRVLPKDHEECVSHVVPHRRHDSPGGPM